MPMDKTGDRKVINMTQFATSSRFQPLREVEAYWETLRAGRLVPRRSDIDPRGIERALEYSFVMERIAPGLGRLRIAGSHLTELMGMEVRGMPLSTLIAPNSRDLISDALEEVFSGPAKVEIALRAEKAIGKPQLDARLILLPLKSDLGDITRVLGCLVSHGSIGRAPRRFEILETEVTALLGDARILDQDGPLIDQIRENQPAPTGMAEDAPTFEAGPRPYLRLVRTDHSD